MSGGTFLPALPASTQLPQFSPSEQLPLPYSIPNAAPNQRPVVAVSSLIDSVLQRLEQVPATPAFWIRTEIMGWIAEGLVELQLISEQVQLETVVPLGNNSITGMPNHIAVIAVRNGNSALLRYSVEDLDGRYPTWENDPAAPYPKGWTPLGQDKIITYPRTSRNDQTLTVVQLQLPATLTEGTTLSLDAEFTEAVIEYAEHVARLKEGGGEFQQAMENYKRFLKWASLLASRSKWKNAPAWVLAPVTNLTAKNARKLVEG